eukprot:gene15915-18919_t
MADKVTRVMIKGQRFYEIAGHLKPFPSVTTVLKMINKPMIGNWEKKIMMAALKEAYFETKPPVFMSEAHERSWVDSLVTTTRNKPQTILTDSGTFGTRAHQLIDDAVLVEKDKTAVDVTTPTDLTHIATAFEAWREAAGLKLEKRDTIVWSPTHEYAGAVDAVGRKPDGSLVAIDWKTSSFISNEYALQVAAYSKALEELHGERISEAWIVRFHKTLPLYESRLVKDLDGSFELFLSALRLFKAYHEDTFYYNEQ